MEARASIAIIASAALPLAACAAPQGTTGQAVNDPAGTSVSEVEVIRSVSWEDWPQVHEECLTDAGFPPSRIAEDGTREYGPYTETQTEDYDRAEAVCRAQYPMESDYATASDEDWIALYAHQRDVWVPCMYEEFGIDLGQIPSQESFLTNPVWVDQQTLITQIEQAIAAGRLENANAWWPICPDFIPFQ